jgi:hypothetical protein
MKIMEAIKLIYPKIQGGYVYWETKQDGSEWPNPIDGLIWENAEFAKPTWQQIETYLIQIELEEAKNKKISQIKALRDSNLAKPTPQTISYEGNLANKSFALTRDDLTLINVIIGDLEEKIANGLENPTRDWTAIEGRFALNVGDFKSLRTHMVWRDELEYTQARLKIEEIKALTTLEEVENYDINKIVYP